MKRYWLPLLLAATLPTLACDGGQEADAETLPEPAQSMQMMELPDTTAQAVWSYIHEADYDGWQLWPGKGEQYEGTDPHGALLTTYLNETAYDALTNGSGPLPNGSIVIKENYMPDGTLAAVTVMYSAAGYDAEHNDYFWAKYQADGSVDAAGRVNSCISCHTVGDRGYLRTPYDPGM
ncbi:MAG: cytochrome P460 family protein [Longimicrobiales bacterium]|nr:cytochrome P460 family protein [Longimicrobiales bacterium]